MRIPPVLRRVARALPSIAVLSGFIAAPSHAWIYPEHRDITYVAIRKLDPDRRAVLEKLWTDARLGYETRLAAVAADSSQSEASTDIDFAAWPAIAGDHSVSGADLLHNILETDWILDVVRVAAVLKRGMAEADNRSDRINSLRDSDIKLQRSDPQYATRAGTNNVHFLLARTATDIDTRAYIRSSVRAGSELNAMGTYVWYHYSALLKAARLSREQLSPADRAALARAALADEAFSLHFLEDAFAAGHVTGTWGDASLRKGTHDYYNERGFETRSWNGTRMVLAGDAWMRDEDLQRASDLMCVSLRQFVDAVLGTGPGANRVTSEVVPMTADTFNVATHRVHIAREFDSTAVGLFAETLLETPSPALASGMGELPRFRAELGPFIGIAPAAFGGGMSGGFGVDQTMVAGMGGLSLAVRLGLGIEGVINESGDGLVFLDLGIRQDAASSRDVEESQSLAKLGAIFAQVPARAAYTTRLRMPFWLIPGDLILAALTVGWISPPTFVQMAVAAGSGGAIAWQAGIATSIGRFQFVLGREVGVSFFGYGKEEDPMLIPVSGADPVQTPIVNIRSIQIEAPLVEYRPFRTFSMNQSSSLVVQLYGGVDIPTKVSVAAPAGAPTPDVRNNWFAGVRVAFDWRYYLGSGTGVHR
jgi:hypothetical protein